jgi:hypothetical protein
MVFLWKIRVCLLFLGLFFIPTVRSQDAARASGWVAISVADYESLRAKAHPVEPSPANAGISAALTRIDYDLHVEGNFAKGQANLTIDVIKDGWVRIPIPSDLVVWEAKLDGKRVSLIANDNYAGAKSAVFFHQGRAVLALDIVLPIAATPSNESISLPPAVAGITRASIQLPRQEVEIKLSGGIFVAEPEGGIQGAGGKWVAYGYGNAPLILSWGKKVEDHRSGKPLRMRGSLTELVGLGEDSTSVQAEVSAEIVQGSAHEMKIKMPDKVVINHVTGAMVSDWETKSGELVVTFLEPVEKTARFVINGETRTPRDGPIDIPLLRLLNVERESGGVAIEVLGAGEIKSRKSAGLDNADSSDLGGIVASRQSPSMAAFRFQAGDEKTVRTISVNVARYVQEAVLMANIEEARYQVLMSEEGKNLVQARYAIRNNQRSFLKITLPPGATIWSASLSGKPIRPGQAPDGSLLLPLEKARAGEDAPAFEAEILYFSRGEKWNDAGKLKIALPELDLPISRTGLNYFFPPLFSVTPEPGSFRLQDYQEPTSAVLSRPTYYSASAGAGSVRGAVKDPSNAVIPAAVVTLKNTQTNIQVKHWTNFDGTYNATGLMPGYYDITVEKDGFVTQLSKGIRVGVGLQTVNIRLNAGKKTDVVEVNIKAENIILDNGPSVGRVLSEDQISKLPLVNSNVLDLVKVMGGVVMTDRPIFGADQTTLQGLSDQSVKTKALVDEYRSQSQEGKRAGIMPVKLSFPVYGPSIFLASELTPENKPAVIGISYEVEKKGGSR